MITAALSGALDEAPTRTDPHFGLTFPTAVAGVDPAILDPRAAWADPAAYDAAAESLSKMFITNFERFAESASAEVLAAGPHSS